MVEKKNDPPAAGADIVQRYRFRVRTSDGRELVSPIATVTRPAPVRLRVVLRDEFGRPRAGFKYRLEIGGKKFEGETGADGVVERGVPPRATTGSLSLLFDENDPDAVITRAVVLGSIPPISSVQGLKARLANLGFDPGPLDDELGEQAQQAIRAFKKEYLEYENPDGRLDDDVRQMIEVAHDGRAT